jgi:hypothetical protein
LQSVNSLLVVLPGPEIFHLPALPAFLLVVAPGLLETGLNHRMQARMIVVAESDEPEGLPVP